MVKLLETDQVDGLAQYTANNLGNFLTRQSDKELMSKLIDNLSAKYT